MESFANTDVDYPDGQSNRVVVPAEIQARGFKPPVRTASGELEKGDSLAANHLNYILNDIYKKFSNSKIIVESSGDATSGYRRYSNGDIEIWGYSTPNASGVATVSYPITLPGNTRNIQLTMLASEDANNDLHSVMLVANSWTTQGFRAKAVYKKVSASENVVPSQNGFIWNVMYRNVQAVNK